MTKEENPTSIKELIHCNKDHNCCLVTLQDVFCNRIIDPKQLKSLFLDKKTELEEAYPLVEHKEIIDVQISLLHHLWGSELK